jgi:predicted metal-dependent phosphoesterase TrpH
VCTMADVAARKTAEALVIAPHPFYPAGVAVGAALAAHRDVFDAVEFSGLYAALTPHFNRRALAYAHAAAAPVVGNSDTHFLWQMGRTWTAIDAPPEPAAVIAAIRAGRVRLVTRPLSWTQMVRFTVQARGTWPLVQYGLQYMLRVVRRTRGAAGVPAGRPNPPAPY